MSLPLVDVNASTATQYWPLLESAVSSADFIALDLELSGLGWHKTNSALDAAERYKLQRDVIASYSVLSMGVACFQRQPSADIMQTSCRVEAFNVWLLSQQSYTIDPSSAKFLIDHGFDFNKQFRCGLPYTPVHACQELKLSGDGFHLPTLFGRILSAGCPVIVHNGLIDLLFLYSHFYASLPPRLEVFMADLTEMFVGGVYDTKAIAELLLHEQASFLEYVFRKKQSQNMVATERKTRPHLELVFADYAFPEGHDCVELVSILPPPLPSIDHLMHFDLCPTFTRFGYCHKADCGRSHDVLIVIAIEEHKLELTKEKRKRKRELQAQRKRRKTSSGDLMTCDGVLEPTASETQKGLTELFENDLSAARAKVEGRDQTSCRPDASPPVKTKPSFGHRAGFDAFMTGYSFACIALTLKKSPLEENSGWLSGVEEMRNKLANRGKTFALQITKSHFTSSSLRHKTAQSIISSFFKSNSGSDE